MSHLTDAERVDLAVGVAEAALDQHAFLIASIVKLAELETRLLTALSGTPVTEPDGIVDEAAKFQRTAHQALDLARADV
jgi:hypothetical protein